MISLPFIFQLPAIDGQPAPLKVNVPAGSKRRRKSRIASSLVGGCALKLAADAIVAKASRLAAHLLDADPALRELEVLRAGLAEAFTELTRETAAEQEAA